MCGCYERGKGYRTYADEFSVIRLPLRFPEPHAAPNLEPQLDLRPTQQAPIITQPRTASRWQGLPDGCFRTLRQRLAECGLYASRRQPLVLDRKGTR